MHLSAFGRAHAASLHECSPEAYAELEREGSLDGYLAEVDAVATEAYSATVMAMLSAHPATGDSFFARLQHTQAIAQQARELVMDDVLPRPSPDA